MGTVCYTLSNICLLKGKGIEHLNWDGLKGCNLVMSGGGFGVRIVDGERESRRRVWVGGRGRQNQELSLIY